MHRKGNKFIFRNCSIQLFPGSNNLPARVAQKCAPFIDNKLINHHEYKGPSGNMTSFKPI